MPAEPDAWLDEMPPPPEEPRAPPAARKPDPWAHRRGEPRTLVLAWTIYLFIVASLTIFTVPTINASPAAAFAMRTRSFLALTAFGLCALLPMTRLSQASPKRPVRASLVDAVSLLIPTLAIVWPTKLLTPWSLDVYLGVSALLAGWTLLCAAVTAIGVASPPTLARSLWMGMCLALLGWGPIVMLAMGLSGGAGPLELWLTSPLTAVFLITDAPGGYTPSMDRTDWLAACAPAAVAVPLWIVAWLGE